jgi:hypothetical protein
MAFCSRVVSTSLSGYGNDPNGPGAGCGGIAMLLDEHWFHNVARTGTLLGNRGQWMMLTGLPGGDLGILNLYASNESAIRYELWNAMLTELPIHYRWVIGSDFNMVEARCDKTSQCGKMLPYHERLLLSELKCHLQVSDHPRSPDSMRYSWDNFQGEAVRVMARLDRFYVFNPEVSSPNYRILRYKIHGDGTRSNHCPVSLNLELEQEPRQKTRWKMNVYWLDQAKE